MALWDLPLTISRLRSAANALGIVILPNRPHDALGAYLRDGECLKMARPQFECIAGDAARFAGQFFLVEQIVGKAALILKDRMPFLAQKLHERHRRPAPQAADVPDVETFSARGLPPVQSEEGHDSQRS